MSAKRAWLGSRKTLSDTTKGMPLTPSHTIGHTDRNRMREVSWNVHLSCTAHLWETTSSIVIDRFRRVRNSCGRFNAYSLKNTVGCQRTYSYPKSKLHSGREWGPFYIVQIRYGIECIFALSGNNGYVWQIQIVISDCQWERQHESRRREWGREPSKKKREREQKIESNALDLWWCS